MGRRGRGKKTETQVEGHGGDDLDGGNGYMYEKEEGFFACYLLCSLSPRFKGHTYIGFTTNPRQRIRQHNGELTSGAIRTKRKRPWEMMLCIYGFPSNVSALQFEWAWQHPMESLMVRKAAASFKSLSGIANKIKLAYTMLTLPSWENLNLTVNFFSSKYIKHAAGCPSLAKHIRVNVSIMEELPCYLEGQTFDNNNNVDDFDEDGSNVSSLEELHCYLKGQIFDNNEDIDDCEKGDKDDLNVSIMNELPCNPKGQKTHDNDRTAHDCNEGDGDKDDLNVSIMNELPCNPKGQKTHDNDRTAHDCNEGDEDDSFVKEIYSESFDKSLLRSLKFDILTRRDASDDHLSPRRPDYSRGIESDKVESTIIIPNSIQSPMKASKESFRQRESHEFVGQQDNFWDKDASTTGRRSLLQLTELSTPIVYKSNNKRKASSAVYSPENNVIDLTTPSSNHKQQRSSSNQPLIFPEFIDLTISPVVCIQL